MEKRLEQSVEGLVGATAGIRQHNVASQLPHDHVTLVTGLSNFHFWC